MVSLPQRMRKLQEKLLSIRLGSGALLLPKEVTRINLQFAAKIDGGHMGPRKFWRNELVRLKYHNPAVSMSVDRTAKAEDPATMSIHFSSLESAEESAAAEKVIKIDMKHRNNSEILEELIKATKAREAEPTEEDREEKRVLEEQKVASLAASKLSQEVRARVKREKELLEQARGDMGSQPA
ncbi:Hypothetical protein R9X50_00637000 [Acrodontium crateriforme]|uniref:Ribosomal protein/NADH dehydrogenase domain-containing protein n=1 Tax=Acrodontium crateriforme TaxID=150365 RepID=A0AAQ3M909_9PEZI|nr:Hypothetical protein R9X50_00637000 [Acrodontium crateriforme]